MKRKRSINSKAVTGIILLIIAVVSAVFVRFTGESDKVFEAVGLRNTELSDRDKMYVSFIDVGQGNCTLLKCGDKAILVDSGEVGAAQTVINYIKNQNIKTLDCVLVTHPHSDHMGAMTKLLYEFEIKDVIMPEIPEPIIPTSKTYEKFLVAVSENAENVIAAKPDETFSYGEMKMEIFAPLRDYDNLNDMSAVTRISYGDTSVMFTGDATATVEKDLLKKNIDYSATILNVGHHGSKTSTSESWLKAVDPEYAVICCGLNNDYGHPHQSVVNRLEEFGIKTYRTDLLGTIVFESNSKEFTKCD
ncbi:MAG TPA: MBL fold metallo-hydrolase [Ruminococcaceae bacterium]|nr:MBL fold metallo-hydrolase [Oscillospiraceae bacterium]